MNWPITYLTESIPQVSKKEGKSTICCEKNEKERKKARDIFGWIE